MIIVVRHGQTDWNLEKRYQGRMDIELNGTGIKQATEISLKLSNIKFDKVFSSPLKRAYATAQLITQNIIITDNRLIERCNGILEGKLKSEIKESIDFNSPDTKLGIENIIDFKNRIFNFLDEITTKYKNQNILIVTHAGVSLYIREYFEGVPTNNDYSLYKLENCDYLEYDN